MEEFDYQVWSCFIRSACLCMVLKCVERHQVHWEKNISTPPKMLTWHFIWKKKNMSSWVCMQMQWREAEGSGYFRVVSDDTALASTIFGLLTSRHLKNDPSMYWLHSHMSGQMMSVAFVPTAARWVAMETVQDWPWGVQVITEQIRKWHQFSESSLLYIWHYLRHTQMNFESFIVVFFVKLW